MIGIGHILTYPPTLEAMDGGNMQVGDLIRVKDQYTGEYITGIILEIRYREILCLWHSGEISWCGEWQIEVINENR